MPDKKVSQSTEHISAVLGTDLLPLVANTATQPTNYKVQVKNFLSQLTIDLPQTSWTALKVSAAVTANAVAATLVAAEFGLVANSGVGVTVRDRYGLLVKNEIQNATSNVTGQFAAAVLTLDIGASNVVAANTYGMLVAHLSQYGARAVAPRAYIGIRENANTGVATSFLLDVGAQGDVVSANTDTANTGVIYSKTADKTANRAVKICVNGETVWLLGSTVGPS